MKRFLSLKSRGVVVVASLAMFMAQLDGAVLTVALPRIARDFAVPTVSLSLSITLYLTMLIALLPVSGWAADRFGPRRVFLSANVGFAVFSVACALAPDYWSFIAARALQGAAASLFTPVGRLIMLKRTDKAELVDALAITAMPMLVAPTFGPLIGGFIVDYGRWEYIFLLNVPVAALLWGLTLWKVPEFVPEPPRPLDWRGALLLGAAMIVALTGLDRLAGGIAEPLAWGLITAGGLLGWMTWRHLRCDAHPIVTLEPLSVAAFRTTSLGAGAVIRLPGRSIIFALPLMFQLALGFSPVLSGLLLMAISAGDLLCKPLVRPMYERFGFRVTVLAANVGGLLALLALLPVEGRSLWEVSVILLVMLASGISRSVVFTGMSSLTFTALGPAQMNAGNVLASISMQLFNALAVSVTALVLSISARAGGRIEPLAWDFRVTLAWLVVIGLWSTLLLARQLPHRLADLHREPDD